AEPLLHLRTFGSCRQRFLPSGVALCLGQFSQCHGENSSASCCAQPGTPFSENVTLITVKGNSVCPNPRENHHLRSACAAWMARIRSSTSGPCSRMAREELTSTCGQAEPNPDRSCAAAAPCAPYPGASSGGRPAVRSIPLRLARGAVVAPTTRPISPRAVGPNTAESVLTESGPRVPASLSWPVLDCCPVLGCCSVPD